jgi:transcriptional regulator with XRE-family HTH domain
MMKKGGKKDGPHWVDVYVGQRIRRERKKRKMTQTTLGEAVGISFQQIQKYEKGTNRISASMLLEIACVFEMQPGSLLPDYWATEKQRIAEKEAATPSVV